MVEYEFRGKRKDNGEWIYGSLLIDKIQNSYVIVDNQEGIGREVIPETIGQYTGLKDKNGKKIFDGDIVSYTAIVTEYEENTRPYSYKDIFEGEVTYDYGSFWINDRQLYEIAAYDDEFEPEIEVIGNIYDNLDLLKEEL